MNSEVNVVLHPCVGLLSAAINRREKRLDVQEPEACAIVLGFVTNINVFGLVFSREGKGREKKVQIRG